MKITKQSKLLMDFLYKSKCQQINSISLTNPREKKTMKILERFFYELQDASKYLVMKQWKEGSFFQFQISKITNVKQIIMPNQFNANSFPKEVRSYIETHSEYNLSYTFSLLGREVNVHFVVEDPSVELHLETFHRYVENIFLWLYFINDYASKKCANKMTIYIYYTSLQKNLPQSNIQILGQNHVNTAFTYTCPADSEIVIFRKEEWFKVLMHETFHNLALDFSDMPTEECHRRLLSLFPVESKVNLFEAYTEVWAEILNVVFCNYLLLLEEGQENNKKIFLENGVFLLQLERTYSIFQMVKTLAFMGLTYEDLYLPNAEVERNTLYKEDSNVLSYYVITTILLYHVTDFLTWCDQNNLSLLQFKKTKGNLSSFCNFIEERYNTQIFLQNVHCMYKWYGDWKKKYEKQEKCKKSKKTQFLLKTMRMSICEME